MPFPLGSARSTSSDQHDGHPPRTPFEPLLDDFGGVLAQGGRVFPVGPHGIGDRSRRLLDDAGLCFQRPKEAAFVEGLFRDDLQQGVGNSRRNLHGLRDFEDVLARHVRRPGVHLLLHLLNRGQAGPGRIHLLRFLGEAHQQAHVLVLGRVQGVHRRVAVARPDIGRERTVALEQEAEASRHGGVEIHAQRDLLLRHVDDAPFSDSSPSWLRHGLTSVAIPGNSRMVGFSAESSRKNAALAQAKSRCGALGDMPAGRSGPPSGRPAAAVCLVKAALFRQSLRSV